ncbi:hypothetical protein [Halocatena halophila]|uniref:hypothetical protein n=1 Tax=Halocatena halophila TaxID=2814576 RepID=UPI002ED5148C
MVSRRQKAVLEFCLSVLLLPLILRLQSNRDEPLVHTRAFAIGAGHTLIVSWLSDHDIWNVRTNWVRRFGVGLTQQGLLRVLTRRSDDQLATANQFGCGSVLAGALYRFWYGVLLPPPE